MVLASERLKEYICRCAAAGAVTHTDLHLHKHLRDDDTLNNNELVVDRICVRVGNCNRVMLRLL